MNNNDPAEQVPITLPVLSTLQLNQFLLNSNLYIYLNLFEQELSFLRSGVIEEYEMSDHIADLFSDSLMAQNRKVNKDSYLALHNFTTLCVEGITHHSAIISAKTQTMHLMLPFFQPDHLALLDEHIQLFVKTFSDYISMWERDEADIVHIVPCTSTRFIAQLRARHIKVNPVFSRAIKEYTLMCLISIICK